MLGLYRPSASAKHLGDLLQLKLEGCRFREPVTGVSVRVLAFDALEFRQQELLDDVNSPERDSPRELAGLVDRLSNRLGAQAVLRPWLLADAQPEFACQYRPVSSLKAHRRETDRRKVAGAQARQAFAAAFLDFPGRRRTVVASHPIVNTPRPPLRTDRPVFLEPTPLCWPCCRWRPRVRRFVFGWPRRRSR